MNVYIYKDITWHPGTDTLLYAPFSDDLVDHSGKSTTMTKSGTVTNTTLDGIKCAYFNGGYIDTNISTLNNLTHTISFWLYTNTNNDAGGIVCSNPCGITQGETIWTSSTTVKHSTWTNGGATPVNPTLTGSFLGKWIHVINTGGRLYVDGNLVGTETAAPAGTYKYSICAHAVGSSCTRRIWYGYLSELIIENKEWTAQEVQDYYDSTKDEYSPKTVSYSYDFRSKSLSQVKSDGWTFTNGESYVTLNSNGIMAYTGTSTGENLPYFYVPVNTLNTALNGGNILTMEVQFYGTTSAWGPTNLGGICSALSGRDFTDLQSIHFSLMTSSGYTNWGELAVRDGTTGTSVCKYTSSVSSGTYKFKATINLKTGAATLQRNSETALTGTISAANLAAIKRCNKVTGRVGHDVGDLYIQTININVE